MLTESAKVIITELDLSSSIEAASELSVALVGQSKKGPINKQVLITNDRQAIDVFGQTKDGYYLQYAGLNYLKYGKKAFYTRIVPVDAKTAVIMADVNGDVTNVPGIKTPDKIQNINEEQVYTLVADTDVISLDLSNLYTYFTPGSVRITISGSIDLIFIDDGSGLLQTSDASSYVNYLDGIITIVKDPAALDFVAGDIVTLSGTYSDFNIFDEYLAGIRETAFIGNGGTSYTLSFNPNVLPNTINLSGVGIDGIDDGDGNIVGTGITTATIDYVNGTGTLTTSAAITSGAVISGSYVYQRLDNTLVHAAVAGPGVYGTTEYKLQIINKTDYASSGYYFNDQPKEDDEMLILLKDVIADRVSETYIVSRNKDAKNLNGTSRFANDFFNDPNQLYVVVKDSSTELNPVMVASFNDGATEPTLEYKYFVSGSDGVIPISDSDFIAGFELYADPQQIDISIIPSLGATSASVLNYLVSMCEKRRCVALLDSPIVADTPQEVVDFRRGELTGYNSFNPNTSFAGLWCGWRKIKDWYNDKSVWVPMSASVLANYAKVFYYEEAWDAVAGSRKGVLSDTDALLFNPQEGDRDLMYGNQCNPVFSSPGKGTRMWGQKTLQSNYSALSFLSTRFLINILTKAIAEYAESGLFERNNASTRNKMKTDIEAYLENIFRREGVNSYKVVCDESNNPKFIIDQRGLIIDVYLVPSSDVESIQLNAIILNNTAKFEEISSKN